MWRVHTKGPWGLPSNPSQASSTWPFSLHQTITSMLFAFEAMVSGPLLNTYMACPALVWVHAAWKGSGRPVSPTLSFVPSYTISHNCSLIYAPFLGVILTNGRFDRFSPGHLFKESSVNAGKKWCSVFKWLNSSHMLFLATCPETWEAAPAQVGEWAHWPQKDRSCLTAAFLGGLKKL